MAETPPQQPHDDGSRGSHLGPELFLAYFALYAGFIYLAAFRPELMASRPFGGANLAVWYGMVLFASPLLLATIYLLRNRRNRRKQGDQ
jgi:uncharacterized membrane protein (DUF485 family)